MNIEFLKEYLVLVVLGICLCAGYILKHLVPLILAESDEEFYQELKRLILCRS